MESYIFVNDGKTPMNIPLKVVAAIDLAKESRQETPSIAENKYIILSRSPLHLVPFTSASQQLASYGVTREFAQSPENQYIIRRNYYAERLIYPVKWNVLYETLGGFLVVFLQNNEFVASVQGNLRETKTRTGQILPPEILWVQVDPKYQGRGICTQIVAKAFQLLKKRHVKQVSLTNEGGIAGGKCYERAALEAKFRAICQEKAATGEYCKSYRFIS